MGALVLGPVVFHGFEVPERIRFGGTQRLAVHALPGGGRVIDAMGPEEAPISWSGVFSGPYASERVRLIERLRRDGEVVPLAWESWRFSVVVERFAAATANPAWIPYSLRACVLAAGDPLGDELLPLAATDAEAKALGAGPGLEGRINAAATLLDSGDVAAAIAGAGNLARLVTARALLEGRGGLA